MMHLTVSFDAPEHAGDLHAAEKDMARALTDAGFTSISTLDAEDIPAPRPSPWTVDWEGGYESIYRRQIAPGIALLSYSDGWGKHKNGIRVLGRDFFGPERADAPQPEDYCQGCGSGAKALTDAGYCQDCEDRLGIKTPFR